MLIIAPAAAQPPLPDAELLLFLAEFADDAGELADPALLHHAQTELDRERAGDQTSARPSDSPAPTRVDPPKTEARGDAQPHAGDASGNSSRARRVEKDDD